MAMPQEPFNSFPTVLHKLPMLVSPSRQLLCAQVVHLRCNKCICAESCRLHCADDSFTIVFANVGNYTTCKSTTCDNALQQLLTCCLHNAGDSFTIGFANVGNDTTCKSTACNPISGGCMPALETEDATVGWGPLTAGNFSADFQARRLYHPCFAGLHSHVGNACPLHIMYWP